MISSKCSHWAPMSSTRRWGGVPSKYSALLFRLEKVLRIQPGRSNVMRKCYFKLKGVSRACLGCCS